MNKKLLLFIISFPFSLICQVDKANEILLDALKAEKIDTTFLPELRTDNSFDYSHDAKLLDENILMLDFFSFRSNKSYQETDSMIISYLSDLRSYSNYKPSATYYFSDNIKTTKKFNELDKIISQYSVKRIPRKNNSEDEMPLITYIPPRAKQDFSTTVSLYISKIQIDDEFTFSVTFQFHD